MDEKKDTEKKPRVRAVKKPSEPVKRTTKTTAKTATKTQTKTVRKTPVKRAASTTRSRQTKPAGSGRSKATLQERIAKTVVALNKRLYVEFSESLFIAILEQLAVYNPAKKRFNTLTEVLSADGMPSVVSFYRWLDRDETGELRSAFSYVSLACADAMADEMMQVAYDSCLDPVVDLETGDVDWSKRSVQRSDLIVKTLQWILSRKAPEKWSTNVKLDVSGDVSPDTIEKLAEMGEASRLLAIQKAQAHALAKQNETHPKD